MLNSELSVDISPSNFTFNPNEDFSLRNKIRDLADLIIRRPLYKSLYKNLLKTPISKPDIILPAKGMSFYSRRKLVNKFKCIAGSRILILGCGTGWDLGTWLKFVPEEIVCVDLYNFSKCWDLIKDYALKHKIKTKLKFIQADINNLGALGLGEFDIIASDQVLEHCTNLKDFFVSLNDLLRTSGCIYSSYSPIWYTWGGDHFSGRNDLNSGFNHIILNKSLYEKYYLENLSENEDIQSGGRYIKLDLFSKFSSNEYLNLYLDCDFSIKYLAIEFNPLSVKVLKNKELLSVLLKQHPKLSYEDFIIKGHIIILEKA